MTATQEQIYQISNQLSSSIEPLLEHLDIKYRKHNDMYVFPCPVHGGDNNSGCSILKDIGIWSCWTHSCQEEYKKNMFGFVRGVLSHKYSRKVTMDQTIEFCEKFFNGSSAEVPKQNFDLKYQSKLMDIFNKKLERQSTGITREQIRKTILVPSAYYMEKRNFSREILDQFDVGDCTKPFKEMFNRAVVPVYDENYFYVGCIGRSLIDHPSIKKWYNSKGFSKSHYLYGLNIAKEHIIKTRTAILVEGQGDVWRCHEAGFTNTIGLFGCDLSDDQLILLETSGCLNLVILTDNDPAGEKAASKIIKKCGRRFNYIRPVLNKKDPGDCSIEELKKILGEVNV